MLRWLGEDLGPQALGGCEREEGKERWRDGEEEERNQGPEFNDISRVNYTKKVEGEVSHSEGTLIFS